LALRPVFFLVNVHQSNNSSVAVSEPQFSVLYRMAPHFQGFAAPLKTLSLLPGNNKMLLKCSADHLKHAAELLKRSADKLKHKAELLKRSADHLKHKTEQLKQSAEHLKRISEALKRDFFARKSLSDCFFSVSGTLLTVQRAFSCVLRPQKTIPRKIPGYQRTFWGDSNTPLLQRTNRFCFQTAGFCLLTNLCCF